MPMWLWRRARAHWKSGAHDSSRVKTPQCQKLNNKPTTGATASSSKRARTAARGRKCRSHKGTVKEIVSFGAAVQNAILRASARLGSWAAQGRPENVPFGQPPTIVGALRVAKTCEDLALDRPRSREGVDACRQQWQL